MTQAIAQYEPRHKIILWDYSEMTIKSEQYPAFNKMLSDPSVTHLNVGDATIHKGDIRRVVPATQEVSELEKAVAGKPQDVKEAVRKEIAKRKEDGRRVNATIIANVVEHYEKEFQNR